MGRVIARPRARDFGERSTSPAPRGRGYPARMARHLTASTAALVTLAALAFTVHAHATGNYVLFVLEIAAVVGGAGAWLMASSRRD